jgi:hypothetical protein
LPRWRFVDGKPVVHTLRGLKDYPATSTEPDALSKDLKQRGFKFVGVPLNSPHTEARSPTWVILGVTLLAKSLSDAGNDIENLDRFLKEIVASTS